jgi:CAAX protease family protein
MVNGRSEPLHPALALAAVLAGIAAMLVVAPLAGRYGLRSALGLAELSLIGPGLLAAALARGSALGPLRPGRLGRRAALVSVGAGVGLWVASLGLFELQYAVWSPPPGYLETFRRLHEALRPAGPLDALLSLAAIALAPALCEEALFRGYLLPSLERPLGPLLAAVASAALFGLIHLDVIGRQLSLYRVPFAFVVGLGLAALRLRSKRLLPCVAAHATLNAITFAAAPFTDDPTGPLPAARPWLGAGLLLLGCVAAVAAVRALVPVETLDPGD